MFTIEQIKAAHSKVKSGADFPSYFREIKELGVTYYDTFVTNGQSDYYGTNNHLASTGGRYEPLKIAKKADSEQFKIDLKAHQQGKTDFLTFCHDCAKSGIEKWVIVMDKSTCTYYDMDENAILEETIPT